MRAWGVLVTVRAMSDRIASIVDALRARHPLRPPATKTPVVAEPSLRAFWSLCDGTQRGAPIQIFGIAEADEATGHFRKGRLARDMDGLPRALAIANDLAGDTAHVFIEGDLAGMVGLHVNGESLPAPSFASLVAFLDATLDVRDFHSLVRELPRLVTPEPVIRNRERGIFEARDAAFRANDRRVDAWVALALTPRDELARLAPYFEARDEFVCGRACEVRVCLDPQGSVTLVEELAKAKRGNHVTITCLVSLRRMGTPPAAAALDRLKPQLAQFVDYFPTTHRR